MVDFPVDVEISDTPVDIQEQVPENPSSAAVADRAGALAGNLGVPPMETIQASSMGDTTAVAQARQTQLADPVQSTFSRQLEQGAPSLEVLQDALTEAQEKAEVAQELEDYFVETGILMEGGEYTVTDLRYEINMLIAEQLFRDKISEIQDDTTVVGYVGDFIDRYFIRHIGIGMYEDLTRRSERKGRELLQAAVTMNPREYRTFISSYIEELAEEGVFIGDNFFALQDGFDEATNAGYDPMAGFNQALVAGELVGLGLGRRAVQTSRAIGKSDHPVTKVAAMEGQEAAAEFAETAIRATDGLDETVKTKAGPSMLDPGDSVVKPPVGRVARIMQESTLSRKIQELRRSGAMGLPEATRLAEEGDRIARSFARRTTNLINDINIIEDATGNPIAQIDYGKAKDGAPFTRKSDATKAANRFPETKAVPVDPEDESKGWVVRLDARIDTTGLADEFDVNNGVYDIVRTHLARILGSNAATDDQTLNAMANMSESSLMAVGRAAEPLMASIDRAPSNSKKAILRVYEDLRSGPDAHIKEQYSREEFTRKFQEHHPKGHAPTRRDYEAWDAIQEFENADWLLRANQTLIRFVSKGYWSVDLGNGMRGVGKRVDELPDGEVRIYNAESGDVEIVETTDVPVWRLDRPMENTGVEYVANPRSVDILDHSDVLGFNAGGHRGNIQAKHFIVLDDSSHPRAIMTAFTEKQAQKAMDQLNNIKAGIRRLGDDIASITPTEELDDLIRANNEWNPGITTFREFQELVAERGWDLTKDIRKKARNQPVENLSQDSPHAGERWEDYVPVQATRYNETLMDFGGGEAYNIDPVSSIVNGFTNAAQQYTYNRYTFDASAAWVKRARREGSGVRLSSDYAADDWINQVKHAEVTHTNTAAARSLKHQQSIIRRRMGMKGPVERAFGAIGQEALDFVFDTMGYKINSGNPPDLMLKFGFQSAFGFFNIKQLYMQGIQAAAIIAISPVAGMKATTSAIPFRAVLHAPSPAVRSLGIKRLAKTMDVSEDEVQELIDYFMTSGRDVVDGDAVELGTGTSRGISGWEENSYLPTAVSNVLQGVTNGGRRLLDAGLVFFKSGERFSRQTAIMTAFFEWKTRNPGVSVMSREGRLWMTKREHDLTFNMSTSSRALFQEGLMRFPTLWLSYNFRAMETVFLGRGFTPAERMRLALVLGPMYGLTGLGLQSAANEMAEMLGIEDPKAFVGLKYGLMDWLISETTGVETALGDQLSPLNGMLDLYKKVSGQTDDSFLSVIGGPAGDITQRSTAIFMEALQELTQGNSVSVTEDVISVLRIPAGFNNIAVATGILQNGLYRSKTGTTLPFEMKPGDAVAALLGIPTAEVTEFYAQNGLKFTDSRKLRTFRREMNNDYVRALQIWREDEERGRRMFKEIEVKIALSGFTRSEQASIRRGLMDTNYRSIIELQRHLWKKDQQSMSTMIGDLLLNTGETE